MTGRFDPDESATGLPGSLGTATEELRSTIEEKLRGIVEAAEARAHEVEDLAIEQALELEQDSERRAKERYETASAESRRMIEAIDAFEREVTEALGSLRGRGEALVAELVSAIATEDPEPPAPAPAVHEDSGETGTTDDRDVARRRVLDLFLSGKPRSDAERMLAELPDGERHVELLDEIYQPRSETQQGSARRRGGRRPRRPGS
jgi:hypothetical protein